MRGDDVQRQLVAEERQERERDQQVVDRRDDRADREAELEAERDVDAGCRQARARSPDRLAASARGRPSARRSRCRRRLKFAAGPRSCSASSTASRRLAQRRPRSAPDQRHADHHLAARRVAVLLDDGVLAAARERLSSASRTAAGRGLLVELHDDDRCRPRTRRLCGIPLVPDDADAGEDDDPGQGDGVPPPADEVEIRILEDMHG